MDILVIHSLYIPYIFPRYVPCIFPCVFLNLWSQEKTSPYRKTTLIFFIDFIPVLFLLAILWFFIRINDFLSKIGPIRALWAHMGPNPDRAPTRTGPQPGPGPTKGTFTASLQNLSWKRSCSTWSVALVQLTCQASSRRPWIEGNVLRVIISCRVLLHGRSTDGRFIQGPFGSIRAHKGPYGPIWAPTRTGPQPGQDPNPDWAPTQEDKCFLTKSFRFFYVFRENINVLVPEGFRCVFQQGCILIYLFCLFQEL